MLWLGRGKSASGGIDERRRTSAEGGFLEVDFSDFHLLPFRGYTRRTQAPWRAWWASAIAYHGQAMGRLYLASLGGGL